MESYIFIVIALAAIGIGMIVAGILNYRTAAEQEKAPLQKHPKKKTDSKNAQGNSMVTWMLGSSDGMDPRRAGRARVTIGIICVIAALLVLGSNLLS